MLPRQRDWRGDPFNNRNESQRLAAAATTVGDQCTIADIWTGLQRALAGPVASSVLLNCPKFVQACQVVDSLCPSNK